MRLSITILSTAPSCVLLLLPANIHFDVEIMKKVVLVMPSVCGWIL
jgi:hypothetical protein